MRCDAPEQVRAVGVKVSFAVSKSVRLVEAMIVAILFTSRLKVPCAHLVD